MTDRIDPIIAVNAEARLNGFLQFLHKDFNFYPKGGEENGKTPDFECRVNKTLNEIFKVVLPLSANKERNERFERSDRANYEGTESKNR